MNESNIVKVFGSLEELRLYVDAHIDFSKKRLEQYSQRLGVLLRNSGQTGQASQALKELSKRVSRLSSTSKKKEEKESKKDKASKGPSEEGWVKYKHINIFRGDPVQGEAEILVAAIEGINANLTSLNEKKKTLAELSNLGLPGNVYYMAYLHDGLPERIIIKTAEEGKQKFAFQAALLTK